MNTSYDDYDYGDDFNLHTSKTVVSPATPTPASPTPCTDFQCVFLTTVTALIFVLGVIGNSLVIWIAGFKMKRSVNTSWYLSLAVSNFLFCTFLPFNIAYTVQKVWIFGRFMCKFLPFILLLNMFSSIFLLVIMSVDRWVVVMFPVWAQNNRNLSKSLWVIVMAWILSVALSSPAAVFIEVSADLKCYYNYSIEEHLVMMMARFSFGFVIPLVIIAACYVVIICKLRANQMARSTKPFRIMTLLIIVFFLCWLPYHISNIMELSEKHRHVHHIMVQVGATLVSASSFLNPFLYAFMGKDLNNRKCYAILSKIENAMEEEEEDRSSARGVFTATEDSRCTSVV